MLTEPEDGQGSGALEFPLVKPSTSSLLLVWIVAIVASLCMMAAAQGHVKLTVNQTVVCFLIGLFLLPLLPLPLWIVCRPGWRAIVVGADGVMLRGRFSSRMIPYHRIRAVHELSRLEIRLSSGELVQLEPGRRDRDPTGAALTHLIQRGCHAWAMRGDDTTEEEPLERGGMSGVAWLRALRKLAFGTADSYRGIGVDRDRLWAVLDDPGARPFARAAAAVALMPLDTDRTRMRLRIAAESMADPQTRRALCCIADSTDDLVLAEELAALHDTWTKQARADERR